MALNEEKAFNFSIVTVNWGVFWDTRYRNNFRNASSSLGENSPYSPPVGINNLSKVLSFSSAGDWFLARIAVRRSLRDVLSISTTHGNAFRLVEIMTSNFLRG